ncbi:carboxylesterase family protein [Amycolatopsis rhabdoformis]|uniref:Carboxylic ester hydrolase n=1 Tax=Amycolatopsis rhabdoformis TaxID=1448059 RepID=A0ABZ1IKE1_9PSEU|nr:carboxylesterase family protein [Amycolatopsis rhabdoformis]WSE34678.1 carboxylesterase family protein [Amycolatopsis rhabdoformis]
MIVELASGKVRGEHGAFRGIPFAQQQRFKAPTPVAAWAGVRDAVAAGPAAIQPPSRLDPALGPMTLPQSEDCLSLNVFTPSTTGAKPVLLWFHGGGFTAGSGGMGWYDGTRLAREADAVVVTANYRLGVFGFLALEGVAPANLGVADQLAALEWVRDNITAFGGDPARVTLGGQSAGAQTSLALWSSPRAKGLIHQVALQSAPVGLAPQTPAEAADWAGRFVDALGSLDDGGSPDLATMPAGRLLDGLAAFAERTRGQNANPFQLVADHDFVPDDLIAAAGPGRALVSWTRDEVRVYSPGARQDQTDLGTAAVFSGKLPDLVDRFGPDATLLRFDWAAPGNPYGACHCIDIPFLFGTHDRFTGAGMLEGAPADVAELADLRRVWTAFLHGERPVVDSPFLTRY